MKNLKINATKELQNDCFGLEEIKKQIGLQIKTFGLIKEEEAFYMLPAKSLSFSRVIISNYDEKTNTLNLR